MHALSIYSLSITPTTNTPPFGPCLAPESAQVHALGRAAAPRHQAVQLAPQQRLQSQALRLRPVPFRRRSERARGRGRARVD